MAAPQDCCMLCACFSTSASSSPAGGGGPALAGSALQQSPCIVAPLPGASLPKWSWPEMVTALAFDRRTCARPWRLTPQRLRGLSVHEVCSATADSAKHTHENL